MAEKTKRMDVKQEDGSFKTIKIGADAENVDFADGETLEVKVQNFEESLEWTEV